ncbi:MAG: Ig-like domain-containing protein [Clostridia bacterium]|nr:Ig-like domain-containing protein [Clostridia bacterium]
MEAEEYAMTAGRKCLVSALVLLVILSWAAMAMAANTLKIDTQVKTLFEGETLSLSLRREGAPAEGDVTWKSSQPRVATVDENGVVTAVSKGRVTITASVPTAKRTYRAEFELTVQRAVETIALAGNITLLEPDDPALAGLCENPDALQVLLLNKGARLTLSASVTPEGASSRKFDAATDNPDIASVRDTTLRATATGQCVLTVKSRLNPDVETRYLVCVIQRVTGLKLAQANKTIPVGGTTQYFVTYTPSTASIQAVTWSSGNEDVATVDENGIVTGVSRGRCQIKAEAVDGSRRSATLSITVTQPAESVTLSENTLTVAAGASQTLKAVVAPSTASDKTVTYTSSDPSVAKVSTSGHVSGVSAGVCTIVCQSKSDPTVIAQCVVTVTQPITRITFSAKELTVNVGSQARAMWRTEPEDATSTAVTFKSSNEKVATVDADGIITGMGRGDARITVTAADGSRKYATMTVHVAQPVMGVHMRNDTATVGVGEELELEAVFEPSNASNRRMTWYSEDESIVTVKGTNRHPVVRGRSWGVASVVGTTEDGGYTTEAMVHVGNYDQALAITDLYLNENQVKITVRNESNLTITRLYFLITLEDENGQPLPCTTTGINTFEGCYSYDLEPGETTRHGRFDFYSFVQPARTIGRVVMTLTGYRTDEGMSWNMEELNRPVREYVSPLYQAQPTAQPMGPGQSVVDAPEVMIAPSGSTEISDSPAGAGV